MTYEAIVVGGGVAGLSAGLVLGRSARRAIIVDGGARSPSPVVHGLFSRDGADVETVLQVGRSQLARYDSVTSRRGVVADAQWAGDEIHVELADGDVLATQTLLLAFGVVHDLPRIEGLQPLWGLSVCHCPFCHAWEFRGRPIAVLSTGDEVLEVSAMLSGWSDDVAVCSNGPIGLTDDQLAALAKRRVHVHEEPIARLEGTKGQLERIVFESGNTLRRDALFLQPRWRPASLLGGRLGCAQTALGQMRVDRDGATTVPGVYAAGDLVNPLQHAIFAAASGTAAGMAIVRALLLGRPGTVGTPRS